MIPPLRSFDDVDGKERGQKKTDDLRAMTALGPRTLGKAVITTFIELFTLRKPKLIFNYIKQNVRRYLEFDLI